MSNKTFAIILVAVLALGIGTVFVTGKKKASPPGEAVTKEVVLTEAEKTANRKDAEEVSQSGTQEKTFDSESSDHADIVKENPDLAALRKRDCESIKDSAIRISCEKIREEIAMRNVTNIRECAKFKYVKEDCEDSFYLKASETSGNAKLCESVSDSEQKRICKENVLKKEALAKMDSELCKEIVTPSTRLACFEEIKALTQQNTQNKQTETAVSTAIKNLDPIACSKLATFELRISCLNPIVMAQKDITLCRYSGTSDEQKRCNNLIGYDLDKSILNEAYLKKDVTLCDKLSDKSLVASCKSMKF